MLIDFYCDENIFLTAPYDEGVYRIVREVINNIYKHSGSGFASLSLSIKEDRIWICSENPIEVEETESLFQEGRGIRSRY